MEIDSQVYQNELAPNGVGSSVEPRLEGPRLWNLQPIRDLLWIAFWAALCYGIYRYFTIFMPVLTALVLAYLFQPLIQKAKVRCKWPRAFTATFIIIMFFCILALLIVGIWPLVQDQMQTLGEKIPAYLDAAAGRFGYTFDLNAKLDIASLGLQLENPKALIEEVFTRTGQAFDFLSRFLDTTSTILLNLFLIPIYFFFFAWKFEEGFAVLSSCVPLRHQMKYKRILLRMDQSVAGFFRGRLVVSAIVVFLYAIGWYFAGVPYWFILGLFAGLLNIIPYASGVFLPVAILLKYVDTLTVSPEQSTFMAIVFWPSFVFLFVQFLEGWVLTPWVQGEQMEMSVPTVLIVVFLGGAIGGFLGLLLSIPIYACFKILFQELVYPKIVAWTLR